MCALKVFENKASQEYKRPDQNFFLKINKREGPNKKFREIKKLPPPGLSATPEKGTNDRSRLDHRLR